MIDKVGPSDSLLDVDTETVISDSDQPVTPGNAADSVHHHHRHRDKVIVLTPGTSDHDLEVLEVDDSSSNGSLCSDDKARLIMEVLEDD